MLYCTHMKDSSIKIRISGEKKEEWQEMASQRGISLSELIISSVDGVPTENVPTKEETEDVPTDVPTDLEEREEDVLEELEESGVVFRGSMFKDNKLNEEINEEE